MSARILVEGAGSVGGLLAGELLSHGHCLTLVTGNANITAAIRRDGIAIDTPERNFTVAAKAYTTLAVVQACVELCGVGTVYRVRPAVR